jgi:hypothetical protein
VEAVEVAEAAVEVEAGSVETRALPRKSSVRMYIHNIIMMMYERHEHQKKKDRLKVEINCWVTIYDSGTNVFYSNILLQRLDL